VLRVPQKACGEEIAPLKAADHLLPQQLDVLDI
jgi:hypothetical protein